jgi:hypothetical protein
MAGFKVKGAVIESVTRGLWAGRSISEQCNYVASVIQTLTICAGVRYLPAFTDIDPLGVTAASSCVVLSVQFTYLPNAQSAILYNWA